jgi:YfiR/HmsC-like
VFRHRCKNRDWFTKLGFLYLAPLRLGVALSLLFAPLPIPAQGPLTAEYRSKANYLANFSSFVEWPQETWQPGKASFLVCVFGEFSFGTSLAELTRGKTVHDRRVEIRWVQKPKELSACQILFITRSEKKRYNQVLDFVRGSMVLTVGETPDFLDAGGVLSFSDQRGSIQFDVNLEAANKARLRISSQLLALARRVVNRTEDAKS